jgi:ABC-2 type transport system ATP-binding protein
MASIDNIAVNVVNMSFCYPGQQNLCLSGITLKVAKGERLGLFGPNGAGKTTLMHLMTGILHCTYGNIRLMNKQVRKHHKEINKFFGFVPQDFSFYQELTPVENFHFFGAWSGLSKKEIKNRTEELLDVLTLQEVRNKPISKFSGGMKRKVNLAIGIIHNPDILFLDEPTVGVDVQTRHTIISYLKKLNQNGTTLIYTSHQLNEAEELCEKIALIDEGKIIAHDYLSKLLVKHNEIGLEGLFLQLTGKDYNYQHV